MPRIGPISMRFKDLQVKMYLNMGFISTVHRYLFYKIYQWNKHAFGEEDTPAFNALLQVSFVTLFNFATFLLLIQIISKLEIFDFLSKHRIYLFVIIFLFLGLNYLLLMRNNRSKSIIQEFDTMPSQRKRKIAIYLTCYLSSIVSFFIMALIFISR
jgi:hypothetical protein